MKDFSLFVVFVCFVFSVKCFVLGRSILFNDVQLFIVLFRLLLFFFMANGNFFSLFYCLFVKRRQMVNNWWILLVSDLLFVCIREHVRSIFYYDSLSYWLNICCVFCVLCIQMDRLEGGKGFNSFSLLLITEVILLFHLLICLCVCCFFMCNCEKMGPAFVLFCVFVFL